MHWGSEPQEMKQERRKTEKESDERKSVPAACHVHRRIIVMTVGIALSVKSRLGVSPISSIPPMP